MFGLSLSSHCVLVALAVSNSAMDEFCYRSFFFFPFSSEEMGKKICTAKNIGTHTAADNDHILATSVQVKSSHKAQSHKIVSQV